LSKALTPAPIAGHLLVAEITIPRDNSIVTPPAGFNFFGATSSADNPRIHLYRKISDGTESTVSMTQSASSICGLAITEWADASDISGLTEGEVNFTGSASITLGPTSAPPSATAIPVASYALTGDQNTPTHGAGWTSDSAGKNTYGIAAAHMATPPNAIVSDNVNVSASDFRSGHWITYWIEP
jgi:hypothetical protein